MANGLRMALVGSRGIPARYGGNEAATEELARKLTGMGFQVCVTCESSRFFKDEYNGITRIGTPSIQGKTLTIPTVNNLASTFHLLLRCPGVNLICYTDFDVALGALVPKLLGKKIIMNTDGIEWKRPIIRRKFLSAGWKLIAILGSWYLKWLEWSAVKLSHAVIADSRAIKDYLEKTYKAKNVVFIPYGARELLNSNMSPEKEKTVLSRFHLSCGEYYLTVGRIVAENNIDKEIKGFHKSRSENKIAIVGNFNEKDGYTKYLSGLRNHNDSIVFLDPIYDKETLGILRKNCFAYIHAYELGGTNPSLLEQMLFKKPILAYDVPFNREVLQGGGIYFKLEDELAERIGKLEAGEFDVQKMGEWQARRVKEEYNWEAVSEQYAKLFRTLAA
jgi:rhamnosyltransferase